MFILIGRRINFTKCNARPLFGDIFKVLKRRAKISSLHTFYELETSIA